ncbi:hypothetical protein ABVT39_019764 [Epinephelus coioides]
MRDAAAAGRHLGADEELHSAGASSGLPASAIRTGFTAGPRWSKTDCCKGRTA